MEKVDPEETHSTHEHEVKMSSFTRIKKAICPYSKFSSQALYLKVWNITQYVIGMRLCVAN